MQFHSIRPKLIFGNILKYKPNRSRVNGEQPFIGKVPQLTSRRKGGYVRLAPVWASEDMTKSGQKKPARPQTKQAQNENDQRSDLFPERVKKAHYMQPPGIFLGNYGYHGRYLLPWQLLWRPTSTYECR